MDETEANVASHAGARVDYLDWLRVIATLSVFVFHSARFFDIFSDWHVRNSTTWLGGSIIVAFFSQWIMPVFFVLAGASTFHSLQSRGGLPFISERALRLLVPFVFGMIVVTAPQAYLELFSRGTLGDESFLQFYPQYLAQLPEHIIDGPWYHLWFLPWLFVFSLVALPLFLPFKKGPSLLARLGAHLSNRWLLLGALFIPLALIDVFVPPFGLWGTRGMGGWCLPAYLAFFLAGYLVFSNGKALDALNKLLWFAVPAAILASASFFPLLEVLASPTLAYGTGWHALAQSIQALNTWCLIIILLNVGIRRLNFRNSFLTYAAEAVLPFYILHQTVIIVIGYFICQWNVGSALKYLIILACSFAAIMLIYEFFIRRWNIMRFLFGMRSKKRIA
jgi:surface polysaccharide O-acyltransferase-like enzyme